MPANERSGLKAAFAKFNQPAAEAEAERLLLGRRVAADAPAAESELPASYPVATPQVSGNSGLHPKPLLQKEAVRQLSFRCPVSLAGELRKKAAFNQLEQQQIIAEGIKRVLEELPDPPLGWEG